MGISKLFECRWRSWPPAGASTTHYRAYNLWVRINKRQYRVIREVLNLYRLDNVVGAIDKLKQDTDLPIARIFLAAYN